ncbi:MAG: MBL fold metallo-hydrolase, partial [Archaeoglobaceae archaeon]
MKVTILSDNKALVPSSYKAEWGFSVLIESDETILLDSGQSVAFENLLAMNKPLPSKIVLSHGHYDHTTGLKSFLGKVKIYAHPD